MSTLPGNDPDRPRDEAIEDAIFRLLAARAEGSSVCPSEVARALAADGREWRGWMPQVRQVAERLRRDRRLVVTRAGIAVDATSPGGPIRLGLWNEAGDT